MSRAMLIEKRKTFTLYTRISLAITIVILCVLFLCLAFGCLEIAALALLLAIVSYGLTLWLRKQATA